MGNVKLIVIYPRPKDLESFERVYKTEHVPMAVEKLGGKTKLVASKIVGSRKGHHRSIALQRSISPPWRLCKLAPHRTAAKRHSRMQWPFLPAAHRSFWSRKRKYSFFKGSDLSPRLPRPLFSTPAPALCALIFSSEGLPIAISTS
jgi:hypothetical protein